MKIEEETEMTTTMTKSPSDTTPRSIQSCEALAKQDEPCRYCGCPYPNDHTLNCPMVPLMPLIERLDRLEKQVAALTPQ
jgi:hypothetical protein